MSAVYPTVANKPWYRDRLEVHVITSRDVYGKALTTDMSKVPANVTIQNLEMREAGGRATRQALFAKLPDTRNIKIGSIVRFDSVDYTVTSVIGRRDHRGILQFWTVDAEMKRGEQGGS